MSDTELRAFPQGATEALAMLYVQNQDLSGRSPEDICKIYWEAYYRIRRCNGEIRNAAKLSVDK